MLPYHLQPVSWSLFLEWIFKVSVGQSLFVVLSKPLISFNSDGLTESTLEHPQVVKVRENANLLLPFLLS